MNRMTLSLCFIGIITLHLSSVLGNPESDIQSKIIGGQEANSNEIPYIVSIYHTNLEHNCGGGILNDRYILTAAHCIINPDTGNFFDIPMEIVVDTVDLKNDPGIRIQIEKAYVPKDYVKAGHYNDIGILKLSKSLDLSNNPQRQKLNLPKLGTDYTDREATIAGFGWTDPNDYDTIGKSLIYWKSNVISDKECQKNWYKKTKNYICAQMVPRPDGEAAGICNGDSGSPLVIDNTVVGVAIIAERNCDERLKAALYTQVSLHLPFIQTVLSGQSNNEIVEYTFPSP